MDTVYELNLYLEISSMAWVGKTMFFDFRDICETPIINCDDGCIFSIFDYRLIFMIFFVNARCGDYV